MMPISVLAVRLTVACAVLAAIIARGALAQSPPSAAGEQRLSSAVADLATRLRTSSRDCLRKASSQRIIVAVAGFSADAIEIDSELGAYEAGRITALLLDRLGRERGISVLHLADWSDVYQVLADQQGLRVARKRVPEAMAKVDYDLLLFVRVLRRTERGALDVELVTMSPDNTCRQSVLVPELPVVAPSHIRPQSLMALVARDFFRANRDATRVYIDRSHSDADLLTEPRADYLERLLQEALEREALRLQGLQDATTGNRARFSADRERDIGPLAAGEKPWRGLIRLHRVPQGAELDVRIALPGETAVSHRRLVAAADLPAPRPGPISIAPEKKIYKVGEGVALRVSISKDGFLYCHIESPAKGVALVIHPVPGQSFKALAGREAPYVLAGPDFGYATREGFHSPEPGSFRLRCLAAPAPLPPAEHKRWLDQHVIERKARGETLTLPTGDLASLLAALGAMGAYEAVAHVQVVRE